MLERRPRGKSRERTRVDPSLCFLYDEFHWALSSAVRAFGLHPKGRPFESDSAHHSEPSHRLSCHPHAILAAQLSPLTNSPLTGFDACSRCFLSRRARFPRVNSGKLGISTQVASSICDTNCQEST